jgi:hypothetical protein
MAYLLKRELVEHARLRALATAIINKEKSVEAFDEYMKTAFPWLETAKGRDRQDTIRILQDEIKKSAGGFAIKPLWETGGKVRSRLKTRVVEGSGPPRSKKDMDALYKKLGKTIPV